MTDLTGHKKMREARMNLGKPNVITGGGAGRRGMHPFQGMRPGMDRCGTEYVDRKILVTKTKIRRSFGVQKKYVQA